MSTTHEIRAEDLDWAEINFESPKEAFKFADRLERMAEDPSISEAAKKQIDDCLDDLFATLFDLG
jgi:hypothetical protein